MGITWFPYPGLARFSERFTSSPEWDVRNVFFFFLTQSRQKSSSSGRLGTVLEIKTTLYDVSHENKRRHATILRSYGELDWCWPQGWVPLRFSDLISKFGCSHSPISNSIRASPVAPAGHSSNLMRNINQSSFNCWKQPRTSRSLAFSTNVLSLTQSVT